MKPQEELTIRGVSVTFPVTPYPQQFALIDACLKAMMNKSNALVEAPTGTGKSLALLAAALSFQRREKELLASAAAAEREKEHAKPEPESVVVAVAAAVEESSSSDNDFKRVLKKGKMMRSVSVTPSPVVPSPPSPKKKLPKVPRIYIASRTHSQISQLVRELKKTVYKPRMVVLGSRDHYCINPKVESLGGGAKNAACKRLLQEQSGCRFNQGKSRVYAHPSATSSVMDVEDLVSLGRQVKGCPYFASRVMASTAELVFCPYNYILEPNIRKNLGIKLENSILIFDEAHNIETMAADVASFECDVSVLKSAVEELPRILDTSEKAARFVQNVENFVNLKKDELVWGGKEILALLDASKITTETFKDMHETFRELVSAAEEKDEAPPEEGTVKDHRVSDRILSSATEVLISNLFSTIEFMLMKEMKFLNDFRAVISRSEERGAHGKSLVTRLHFWCCSSAAAFEKIKEEARTVILASGTLAPMESFASELGLQFDVRLETGHVVDTSKQLFAGVVPYDASGDVVFNWSYKNTENVRLQDALGNSVLDIARVVPGGMLIFFGSYGVMNKVVQRWKTTKFWETLNQQKLLLVEPNGPIDDVIASYYRANIGSDGMTTKKAYRSKGGSSGGVIVKSQTGGLLMAVCRGKVSEGIDFTDGHCRAVLIVGVPFPNTKDLQLRLKKEDHDAKSRSTPGFLNGSAWYTLQAFRALNQAIGRCIRHRNDFGAIILLDERFLEKRTQESMSRWIRPVVAAYPKFSDALVALQTFFARNDESAKQTTKFEAEAPVSGASRRWCCAKCARPIALSAAPSLIASTKEKMMELNFAWTGEMSAGPVNVYCFDMKDLNSAMVTRAEGGAVYNHNDRIAYLGICCTCSTTIGVYLEAVGEDDLSYVSKVWACEEAFLK